jgi:hypothetical protein
MVEGLLDGDGWAVTSRALCRRRNHVGATPAEAGFVLKEEYPCCNERD